MNETRVTTGEVRFSYAHVFKPYAYQVGGEEKYSVTCLLPKSDTETKARLDAAIEAAKQVGISKVWQGVCPPVVPVPIHDGDGTKQDGTPFPAECKGCWVFTASAKADRPPEVVDAQLNPIITRLKYIADATAELISISTLISMAVRRVLALDSDQYRSLETVKRLEVEVLVLLLLLGLQRLRLLLLWAHQHLLLVLTH